MDRRKNKWKALFSGVAVGIANGFFGGGGGMIAVPLLSDLVGLPEKTAHATAIFVILPLSLVSGVIYASFGHFPFQSGLFVAVGVFIGGVLGAFALKKMSVLLLSRIFTAAMLLSGLYLLFFA